MGTYDRKLHQTAEDLSVWTKREMRYAVVASTVVSTSEGRAASAVILNLSNKGCRVRTALPLAVGERVTFVVEPHGMVEAEVCWRSEADAGLQLIARDPFYRDYTFCYPP